MDDTKFDDGIVSDEEWDFYSGLPNPSYYQSDDGEGSDEG